MKIKRLEIAGFKSFADRVVVEFRDGITGIVGPNGCGKSNIVDAIRWVMGEMSAKHLRGKSMADVIFAGTQNRSPVGMAEVTLVFSSEGGGLPVAYAEYSEIAVRRRLHRSGESEYSLNGTPCRLKDIHDLFLGTGVGVRAYSIIEQGRIGQVLGAKPEERRLILEEAAGISKFKTRKDAALRKIDATRSNLLRLEDILSELDRQINSLNRQARKAERYQEIQTELKELDLHLNSLDYLEAMESFKGLEGELQKLQGEDGGLAGKVSEYENVLEQNRIKLLEQDREYMSFQEQLYEKNNSLQLNQAQVEHKKREIETICEQNETTTGEIELVKDRLKRLQESLSERNDDQIGVDFDLAQAQEIFQQIEQQLVQEQEKEKIYSEKIEVLDQKIYAGMQALADHQSQKDSLARSKVDLKGRIGRDQSEIDEIDRLAKSHQKKVAELQGQLDEDKQLKINLGSQKENIQSSITQQKESLEKLELQLTEIKDALAMKKSRLASLEDLEKTFEGYQEGVRNIMVKRQKTASENQSVFGTVADIVETDSDFETAVSAALGEKLQYVVVQDQAVGLDALQYLKSESSGRLTCIPLQVRRGQEIGNDAYAGSDGVVGPLKNFVKLKGNYQEVSNYLFDDIYLVESLGKALNLWNQNAVHSGSQKTMVTMDGELVDASGVVSGGSQSNPEQGLLEKKREIKELKAEINILESQLRHKNQEIQQARSQISHLETSLENLQKDHHSGELKIVHQEQSLNHLKDEMKRLNERRDKLSREIATDMQQESDMLRQVEEVELKVTESEATRTTLHEDAETCKSDLRKGRVKLEEFRQKLLESKSNLAQAQEKKNHFENDLDRLNQETAENQNSLDQKHQWITQANEKVGTLKNEIEEHQQTITKLVEEIQQCEASSSELKEQVTKLQNEVQSHEVDLRQNRQRLEALRQQLQEKNERFSEARTQVQLKTQQILERYQIDLSTIAEQYRNRPIDREDQKTRAEALREKMHKMGSVNLDAIEEYGELKKRHEFLQRQYQDLENSLDGLLKALQKVNRTTKKRLSETFEKVNELFKEVFPKLFKGGQAELRLTDPDNILESGVEMVAQPPGKKLQNVALMSGGEKALTAISLVFSIFLLKPSPFCLLDEVDAPLDDVNIGRFNEMVRSMVERSQFILITHNKQTMEMADVLYGITMEQPGVSKLLSVELN